MKAYYYDDIPGDCRLPHETSSSPITLSHLQSLGILYRSIPVPPSADPLTTPNPPLDTLAQGRNYAHRDVITVSPSAMGAIYEDKIKTFFAEHMHEDEEIRYCLDGAGYFDIRERGDERWIRVRMEEGDLLVLPAGVYHRFTVDGGNYIKAMRLFKDAPKWTPLNRGEETEVNDFRKEYVQSREKGFADGTALQAQAVN